MTGSKENSESCLPRNKRSCFYQLGVSYKVLIGGSFLARVPFVEGKINCPVTLSDIGKLTMLYDTQREHKETTLTN